MTIIPRIFYRRYAIFTNKQRANHALSDYDSRRQPFSRYKQCNKKIIIINKYHATFSCLTILFILQKWIRVGTSQIGYDDFVRILASTFSSLVIFPFRFYQIFITDPVYLFIYLGFFIFISFLPSNTNLSFLFYTTSVTFTGPHKPQALKGG